MKNQRFLILAMAVCFIGLLFTCQEKASAKKTSASKSTQTIANAKAAYTYLYPLVLMDYTQSKNTHVAVPDATYGHAPVNQLGRMTYFPTDTFKAVVKPNVDTYYSTAFLNLETPMVLTYPAVTERYFILPLLDAYGNVFSSLGSRTTDVNESHTYLIVNQKWKAEHPNYQLPEGIDSVIVSHTDMVWLLGRTEAENGSDQVAIDYMDEYGLIPLSQYPNWNYQPGPQPVDPNFDTNTPTKDQVDSLSIEDFFTQGAHLMVKNPPTEADIQNGIVEQMRSIGIVPGKDFTLDFSPEVNAALTALPTLMTSAWDSLTTSPIPSTTINGWNEKLGDIGNFGTDYQMRAIVGYIGLGANIKEDAVYPATVYRYDNNDISNEPIKLDASNNYTLTMTKDQIPPVDAFWSITPYNAENYLVKNPINRFALGDRSDLYFDQDSSLTFYVSNKAPINKDEYKNWLPIPASGNFNLTMRLYMPDEAILDTVWTPPFIELQ